MSTITFGKFTEWRVDEDSSLVCVVIVLQNSTQVSGIDEPDANYHLMPLSKNGQEKSKAQPKQTVY